MLCPPTCTSCTSPGRDPRVGAGAQLPLELIGRLAADPDPPHVHTAQMVRRTQADEVFRVVRTACRAELDVMRVNGRAAATRHLAQAAVARQDLLLQRAPP